MIMAMAISTELSSTMTPPRAMSASWPASTANLVSRQLAQLAETQRLEDLPYRSRLWDQDVYPSFLQSGEGPAAKTRTSDSIDVMSPQLIDMVAASRMGVKPEIAHDLQVSAVDLHNREERGTAEMTEQLRLESQVILGRNTDLHDELLPR